MDNQYQNDGQAPDPVPPTELKPLFRVKRTEAWDLARAALVQASPDGGENTNYVRAISFLTHAAAFVAELAMVYARDEDQLSLVEDCVELNRIEFSRLMEGIYDAATAKRSMLSD